MAQVTYNGPGLSLSVPVRKRPAKRGEAFVCQDPKELDYFRRHPDFSVVEPPKKKAAVVAESLAEPTPEPEPAIPPPARRARRAARPTGGDDGQS